jgi:alkylated DNA repair dioxygenase AlkB
LKCFRLLLINLLPHQGEVFLIPNAFPNNFYQKLEDSLYWETSEIKLFGKSIKVPRLTAFYGAPNITYSYSGLKHTALPWTQELKEIKQLVDAITKTSFNVVLANYYRTGQDSMGWHRDNEKELGLRPTIASVSFGATRIFKLRNRVTKEIVSIPLENNSLLIMKGNTQTYWEHCLPKTTKKVGGRINLTFRNIL